MGNKTHLSVHLSTTYLNQGSCYRERYNGGIFSKGNRGVLFWFLDIERSLIGVVKER